MDSPDQRFSPVNDNAQPPSSFPMIGGPLNGMTAVQSPPLSPRERAMRRVGTVGQGRSTIETMPIVQEPEEPATPPMKKRRISRKVPKAPKKRPEVPPTDFLPRPMMLDVGEPDLEEWTVRPCHCCSCALGLRTICNRLSIRVPK